MDAGGRIGRVRKFPAFASGSLAYGYVGPDEGSEAWLAGRPLRPRTRLLISSYSQITPSRCTWASLLLLQTTVGHPCSTALHATKSLSRK